MDGKVFCVKTYFSEKSLESFDLVLASVELAPRQLEECRAELKQENVGQSMLMHEQHTFDRSPHSDLLKLITHSLESSGY